MKTKMNFKLIAMVITIATAMTSINAEAQTRRYSNNNKTKQQKERVAEIRKMDKKNQKQIQKSYKQVQKNQKKLYNYQYNNNQNRYEYQHPQYGHVYRKFYTNPIKLRYNRGNVYFYGRNYYRFQRGVGYVRIVTPRNLVFVDLPFRLERVRLGTNTYYRHGDLVFERYSQGYRLAANVNLHFNLN